MSICACPIGSFPSTDDVKCKENFGQIQKVIFVDMRYYGTDAPLYFEHLSGGDYPFCDADGDTDIISFIPNVLDFGQNGDCMEDWLLSGAAEPDGILSLLETLSGGRVNENNENVVTSLSDCLVQVSPFLEAPSQEPGEARTFGGGNDTPNGVERYLGMGPSAFSAVMRGVPQRVIAKMKELICLSQAKQLGVILVNGEGHIEMSRGKDVMIGYADGESSYGALWPFPIRNLRISDKIHGGYEEPDYNEISWDFLPNYSDDAIIITEDKYLHPHSNRTILEMRNSS